MTVATNPEPVLVEKPVKDNRADTLWDRSYGALVGTSFLGAANDNVVKTVLTNMVATGLWAGQITGNEKGEQAIPAVCLTIPFILLSGYAGQLADRYSKREILLWVKAVEIPLALFSLVAFWTFNVWLALIVLVLFGVQSSFFGPAKFGAIPETLKDHRLSPANGVINMISNLGVIFGIAISGPVTDLYALKNESDEVVGQGAGWTPGLAIVILALFGLVAVLGLRKLKPQEPNLRLDWNPFVTYIRSFRDMGTGPLFVVICAWAGFYMIGMMELLIIPEYKDIFEINYTQLTFILLVLSIAIGIGSVVAGFVSGKTIRPILIPIGGVGMTVGFLLMGVLKPSFALTSCLLFVSGFSAGFYIVPLQALIQYLSPADERGRFLGTANAMSFVFVTLGAGLYYWLSVAGMSPVHVNRVLAALAFVGMVIGIWQMKRVMAGKSAVVTPGE